MLPQMLLQILVQEIYYTTIVICSLTIPNFLFAFLQNYKLQFSYEYFFISGP